MIPGPIRDFVDASEFHAGFAIGVGLAVIAGIGAGRRRRRPVAVGGLLVGIGFAAGIWYTSDLPGRVLAGLVLLGAGGFVAGRMPRRGFGRALGAMALAVPGAVALATRTGSPNTRWVALCVVVSIAAGAPLVADFDRRLGTRGWTMVLYAISVVGVYFTVPDTERALVLLGVALPLLLLGWPVPIASMGWAGSYVAVGSLMWVGAFEGRGRHTAIIGAVGCLALLVAEPIAHHLRRDRRTIIESLPATRWAVVPVALAHLALVYIASRVAGVRHAVGPAALIVACEYGCAVAVLSATARPARRRRRAVSDI